MTYQRHLDPERWDAVRHQVWTRDTGRCPGPSCTHAPAPPLAGAHRDEHRPLTRGGTNALTDHHTRCWHCHGLRVDHAHQGMIGAALRDGVTPPTWRTLVWDDDDRLHGEARTMRRPRRTLEPSTRGVCLRSPKHHPGAALGIVTGSTCAPPASFLVKPGGVSLRRVHTTSIATRQQPTTARSRGDARGSWHPFVVVRHRTAAPVPPVPGGPMTSFQFLKK